mmetsp:Transcript_125707/g.367288  ORF Transcript_125707/g.367288 Transcript_125707/m.367288 type:complete len:907 (+) Transcript_125707:108-2828(+)
MQAAGVVENAGVFGWGYNRANYKFDQTLRWQRFTTGRKMAIAQVGMFRQDCTDLAAVAQQKMKVYSPILTMSLGYCITVFVEGRSGLKFPGPPVFVSGIYLQCLGVGFAFMTLATWLVFHAAIRAQVASVQLRTRIVRLPVPTQWQLDGARKLLSTWEENNPYDMFKVPFVMPNSADPKGHADVQETEAPPQGKVQKGGAGKAAAGKPSAGKPSSSKGAKVESTDVSPAHSVRMPGATKGAPGWVEKEMAHKEQFPKASGDGKSEEPEFLEHFELLRQAQKEYWGAEAYCRVCFLFGMMHLIHAFGYWLVLHCIAELAMVWCANVCAAGLTAGVWLMFRLDVLPDHGGCMPIEAAGPFVTAIALTMMYTGHYTESVIDISRAVAVLVLIMHILWTFRLYSVAKPANTVTPSEHAKESGGRLFNESAACALPSWLPRAFQHCTYLVAPPKPKRQMEQEMRDRVAGERPADVESEGHLKQDPIAKVDMTPWYYTRAVLFAVLVGWLILLTGRIVEATMGERMLVTNPGAPPWTRTGQWYGWEHGPISSKHYAHVTPQRGHWAWQKGWGPQGQQELWASDMFGFAPEADAWWAEETGPEPRIGAAGIGENTWAKGLLAYGTNEVGHRPMHSTPHDWLGSGGHRRLRSAEAQFESPATPAVPLAVQWPAALEPDLLACGPGTAAGGPVVALTASGLGAVVPAGVAVGKTAGAGLTLSLKGLLELGMARGVTWSNTSLHIVTGSGTVATCPGVGPTGGAVHCSPWTSVPKLPLASTDPSSSSLAVLLESSPELPLRAAIASGGRLSLLELRHADMLPDWQSVHELDLPDVAPVALSHSAGQLTLMAESGAAYSWDVRGAEPTSMRHEAPVAGSRRTWRSACALPNGRVMRLAANWRKASEGGFKWHPELLL